MDNKNGILLNESYLLTQVVDKYMIRRMISNKKYYPAYLTIAGDVWRYLFKNTIFSTQSEWMELQQCSNDNFGNDRHPEWLYYIDMPRGVNRLFSVCEQDHCGNTVPLFYNNEMNVVKKPKKKRCKCTDDNCDCAGGICDDANAMSKTTKLLFTINGVDYYETIWLKVCPNGDIVEYRNVPAKKYNSYTGDGGDYNADYNNDYLVGSAPFSDYTIVYKDFQKIICKLDVNECGCPKNTVDNQRVFNETCCGFLNCCSPRKERYCQSSIGDINDNGRGHVKVSDCGTRIYYKPSRFRHNTGCNCSDCCDNRTKHKLPDYLLVNYQGTGQSCNSAVQVPEYALEAMFAGIDYFSKMYNNSFSASDKQQSKWLWTDHQNQIIAFLNPLMLSELANVQDAEILF